MDFFSEEDGEEAEAEVGGGGWWSLVCGIWMVNDLVVLLATTLALVLPALVGLVAVLLPLPALPMPPPTFFVGGPADAVVFVVGDFRSADALPVVEDDEDAGAGVVAAAGGGVEGLREGDAK